MRDINVMIVDDSPFQITLLSDILKEKGFNVVGQAGSLEEVKTEVEKLRPDVVTMDMTIPGTSGFECTEAILQIDNNIKVIVVSSMMDDELIEKAKKIGVSGYVQKPVDGEELSLIIKRAVADDESFEELTQLYVDIFKEAGKNLLNRLTKTLPKMISESFDNTESTNSGISIIIGIIGKYSGRFIFESSYNTAKALATELLRREPKDDTEVFNAISEVANMYAGNACSMLNKKNKIFGLRVAPATTIYGESISISKAELEVNYSAKMDSKFGEFDIKIGFKRGECEWMLNI
ncbi:response regulator [Clostridium sp. SM-530-WT-3G]|uniref:response regulator n=1 Tax=Clostridium sp. SM-530-WT-3G TaxID=2725303 RepID=UPI00145D82B6|nr:response regulator [Clostridium sp. SM-530-WT-3G]NME82552.1 response regulator [Clostridium sp. SM-530-WT-3G]